MSESLVRTEDENGVAWIVLNDPPTMNALSIPLLEDLEAAINQVAAASDVSCVVLTGEGRAFSAGGDLAAFKSDIDAGRYDLFLARLEYAQQVFNLVENLTIPVIAAVNGVAVAGGLELLLCCDIIYAAETARIGDGHAKYGVIPAGGSSVRLPRRISSGHAAEMLFSGELFSADELKQWGLVNRVLPDAELTASARQLAHTLCSRSQQGLIVMKKLLRHGPSLRTDQGLRAEIDAMSAYAKGPDFREGLTAFAEKRSPEFGKAS